MSNKKRREIPRFNHPIIETHCHLDYLEAHELEQTLVDAGAVGVTRLITISVSSSNQKRVADLAQAHEAIYCTQGIHPHEASNYSSHVDDQIRRGCRAAKVVAIGEIGLDYYYMHAEKHVQHECFEAQLRLAAEYELPVVIHTRDAEEDTQNVLAAHLNELSHGGVLHSFSSKLPLAEFALDSGWYLGFNGMVTFKNADQVREAVRITPLDRLLLETDSPYLTPEPYRGRKNSPAYLPFIAERIAEIKDVSVVELLRHCQANSERLFFAKTQRLDSPRELDVGGASLP